MKTQILSRLATLLVAAAAGLATQAQTSVPQLNVTPLPRSVAFDEGAQPFVLPKSKFTIAMYGISDPQVWDEASRFVTLLAATGRKGKLVREQEGDFRFRQDKGMAPEAYSLRVARDGVEISFATAAGLFYGLQTFKKMLPPHVLWGIAPEKKERYEVAAVRVDDEPRFPYRGFMLDVSRHFFPVEQIKRVLDIMAVYKMNHFHWHLTDDQGWRIRIDRYPRLTEVGSVSKDMLMNDETRAKYMLGQQYGPYFYTKDDVSEVVRYAAERHITVVPEVDMPGHMMAAMASYPEFSCRPEKKHEVWTQNHGLSVDILDVSNPAAVQFARDVVDELCEMFPGPYIHIGGDECPIVQWEESAECRAMAAQMGLASLRGLQNWFVGELARTAQGHGKKLFAWNESVTSKGAHLKPLQQHGVSIMCWVGAEQAARTSTQHGMDVVITPIGPYYINRKQWNSPDEPFAAGPGNDSLSVTYRHRPIPADVDSTLHHHYKGVQATFWTEFVCTGSYLEYLMLPRLMAVAEAGWTPEEQKDFPDFVRRFNADVPLLDLKGYNYGKHYLRPEAGTTE